MGSSKAYVHKQLRHLVLISTDVIEDKNLEMVDSLPPDGNYKYVDGEWIVLEENDDLEQDSLDGIDLQTFINTLESYKQKILEEVKQYAEDQQGLKGRLNKYIELKVQEGISQELNKIHASLALKVDVSRYEELVKKYQEFQSDAAAGDGATEQPPAGDGATDQPPTGEF